MTKKNRVVITGIGSINALGHTMTECWNRLMEGSVPAARVKTFDPSGFPTTFAYEVSDWPEPPESQTRAASFAWHALKEACSEAKLDTEKEHKSRDVILGLGMFSPDYSWYSNHYLTKNFDQQTTKKHLKYYPHQLSTAIAKQTRSLGSVSTVHTACASSGNSLCEAYERIAYGEAEQVITGGADSMINPYYFAGFNLLGTLSTANDQPKAAVRAFDTERNGFVLGEGACILIFENLMSALKRDATIIAEVSGIGLSESAYRVTDLPPDGEGPAYAMQAALDDAKLNPINIDYLNAHGTSTKLNDEVESLAIRKVFGRDTPLVSSTKTASGHLISAAGAFELAVCANALRYQSVPPSLNVTNQDPRCPVKLTGSAAGKQNINYALSNSVGFGGTNTAIIVGAR